MLAIITVKKSLMFIISIKNLNFSYDKEPILQDINLEVKEGDFLAIIGPNGGGKSTLFKTILGLVTPKSGTVKVLGDKPQKSLSKIGYVPQNTNINTDFPIKVIEVVMMGHVGHKRPLFGYAKEEISCAMGVLAQVGMQEYAQTKIGSLSGGQRQRVMIARALCAHPKVLLLDEPTASIDVAGQKQIYELLKELNKFITVVVVSHDISVIMGYANRVAYVNKTLTFHELDSTFKPKDEQEHFCEVEMLQLLSQKKDCKC